uniref:Uncharacterized protein n=1 Tax=Anopheles atroparvus TaxID=41427 RepID=A0A182J843_ANOAO
MEWMKRAREDPRSAFGSKCEIGRLKTTEVHGDVSPTLDKLWTQQEQLLRCCSEAGGARIATGRVHRRLTYGRSKQRVPSRADPNTTTELPTNNSQMRVDSAKMELPGICTGREQRVIPADEGYVLPEDIGESIEVTRRSDTPDILGYEKTWIYRQGRVSLLLLLLGTRICVALVQIIVHAQRKQSASAERFFVGAQSVFAKREA